MTVDVFEEERLLRVCNSVNTLVVHKRFVQFYRVVVVLDLVEVVLLAQEPVQVEVVNLGGNLLEVHLDEDDTKVIFAQVEHEITYEGSNLMRTDGAWNIKFEELLVLDDQLMFLRSSKNESSWILLY